MRGGLSEWEQPQGERAQEELQEMEHSQSQWNCPQLSNLKEECTKTMENSSVHLLKETWNEADLSWS